MKAGENLVINLSTAAFECFKSTLHQLFEEKAAEYALFVDTTTNTDSTGAIVDTC